MKTPYCASLNNSVCHSIAHHAVSGLSHIHPHVLLACRAGGVSQMAVSLLEPEPCPESFRSIEPLRLSLRGLRARFGEILAAEGFSAADLSAHFLSRPTVQRRLLHGLPLTPDFLHRTELRAHNRLRRTAAAFRSSSNANFEMTATPNHALQTGPAVPELGVRALVPADPGPFCGLYE